MKLTDREILAALNEQPHMAAVRLPEGFRLFARAIEQRALEAAAGKFENRSRELYRQYGAQGSKDILLTAYSTEAYHGANELRAMAKEVGAT